MKTKKTFTIVLHLNELQRTTLISALDDARRDADRFIDKSWRDTVYEITNRIVDQSVKPKFVQIETRPYGPNVLVVDIYQGDENMKPLGTFRMVSVTKIELAGDKPKVFIEAGDTIDDIERRALAMLEAVRVARELEQAGQVERGALERQIHVRETKPAERFNKERDLFIAWYDGDAAGTMAETREAAIEKLRKQSHAKE